MIDDRLTAEEKTGNSQVNTQRVMVKILEEILLELKTLNLNTKPST